MQERVTLPGSGKVVSLPYGKRDHSQRAQTSPLARIHLLGSMRATSFRHADILPRGKKARALLGCLCLADGARVSRARIAAMLWDRVPDFQGRASFRQAFRELVVAFGPLADMLLSSDRETVRLDTAACWIDAVALLSNDSGSEKGARGKLAQLCKGDLLEDLSGVSPSFDQWVLGERSRFTESLRHLLEEEMSIASEPHSEPSAREEIARRLTEFDPTHEGASRVLMRALADRHERGRALAEYKRCQQALKLAYSVEPSPETRALYEAIRMFSRDTREVAPAEPAPEAGKPTKAAPALAKRSHRRVGVLPFAAIPPEVDDRLSFTIAQEVAAALGRFRWFDVVAPMALVPAPAPSFINDSVLRRRDLDYVVDGSVALSGGMYQISVRLLNLTQDATPVWSKTVDLPTDRLDQLDERVTAQIVSEIDPVIHYIEGRPRTRDNDDAIGCVLRAIPLMYTMERAKYEEAGRLIEHARLMEPDNAMVLAWAAYWRVYYVGQGWAADPKAEADIALDYARRATQLDPNNAEALGIYAHIWAFLHKDPEMALHYFGMALKLNRHLPFIYAFMAVTYCYLGEPEKALARVKRCQELTSTQPFFSFYINPEAIALMMKGDYEEAVKVGRRVIESTPEYGNGYKPLIAALGHLGRRKEAKRYVDRLLAIEPRFTVKGFAAGYPFQREDTRDHYVQGLRLAGIPEG